MILRWGEWGGVDRPCTLIPKEIHTHNYIYFLSIFKTRIFEGIGESKSGLPLGRLTLRMVSLNVSSEDIGTIGRNSLVRLRVDIKSKIFILSYFILFFSLFICYFYYYDSRIKLFLYF